MGSLVVCVLKGKNEKDVVWIAVDYRYLNNYCPSDAHPMPDITELIQRVSQAQYIELNQLTTSWL